MGGDLNAHLRLKRTAKQSAPDNRQAKTRQRISRNAILGMGLWVLLWLGYNTGPYILHDPRFPANTMQLVHGVRMFFPMLAAWISLLLLLIRSGHVLSWIQGPIGLMILYAVIGLASSATISPGPEEALYYGSNYLAIALVLLAIVQVENPLPDLRNVLRLTWTVSTIITLSLLGGIPLIGEQMIVPSDINPIGLRPYSGSGLILGMTSTRNTGFARYAAVAALVALPGLMKKSKPLTRVIWGILFAAALYALILANGRTEIAGFIGGAAVIFGAEKANRVLYALAGTGIAIVLGLEGFYSKFFLYFTRTGHLDLTMTGRTVTWSEGIKLLWRSPWVGFGFQADRFFLAEHMHNAFLHVLVQSGLLGGGAMLVAFVIVWHYLIRYFFIHPPADKSLIPSDILAVFVFITINSIGESTFAYYSAAWLLSAPIFAYAVALHRHMKRISAKACKIRASQARIGRRRSPDYASAPINCGVPPATGLAKP